MRRLKRTAVVIVTVGILAAGWAVERDRKPETAAKVDESSLSLSGPGDDVQHLREVVEQMGARIAALEVRVERLEKENEPRMVPAK